MSDTQFPESIDSPIAEATLAASTLSSVDAGSTKHSGWMRRIDTAVQALQTKVGVDASADTASLDYRVTNLASWAQDVRQAVRVATTANITLTGAQTIDGVSVVAGDRVLVKDQTTGSANGIYVVASGAWARATDADSSGEVTPGLTTFVTNGTANGSTGWILITAAPIVLGTTSLTFQRFAGVQSPLPIANGGTGATGQTAAFDALAPTTTKGDTIVSNGTDNVRLAVGTNGQILTADSTTATGVKWAAAGSNAWSAVPAWVAPYGSSSTYADHATYVCVATGPTDSTGIATDSTAIRALCALGPVVFTPGTIYLNTSTSNGYRSGLFVTSGNRLSALIPGATTLALANSTISGRSADDQFQVVSNVSIGSGSIDTSIELDGLIFDARAANQGTGTYDVFDAGQFRAVNGLRITRCTFKNARGTGSSTSGSLFEKWNLQIHTSKNVTLIDCEVFSDSPGTYGATGCGIQRSDIGTITRLVARNNKFHGMNCHASDNLTYTDCQTYSNTLAGTLCEMSRDVHYQGCTFGGVSNHLDVVQTSPVSTSRGNGTYGLSVQASDSVVAIDCTMSHNETNLNLDGVMTDGDATGLTFSFMGTNIVCRNPTLKNVNLINGSSLASKFTNLRCSGASGSGQNYDVFIEDTLYGTLAAGNQKPGSFNLANRFGGVIISNKKPNLPAAGVSIVNQFCWRMCVTVSGGNNVNLTVDGRATGSSTMAFVEPGATLSLGTYTGTPSWEWTIAS